MVCFYFMLWSGIKVETDKTIKVVNIFKANKDEILVHISQKLKY